MRGDFKVAVCLCLAGAGLVVATPALADEATPCSSSLGDVDRIVLGDGVLSGRLEMPWDKNSMCIRADSLHLTWDFVLLTRGKQLEIQVKGALMSDPGAVIEAFEYDQDLANAL